MDQTARKTLNSLMRSLIVNSKVSTVIESFPFMCVMLDDESGEIIEANDMFCKYLGYYKEELIGKEVFGLLHPDDVQDTLDAFERFRGGQWKTSLFMNRYRHNDGHYVPMYWVTNKPQNSQIDGFNFSIAFKNKLEVWG